MHHRRTALVTGSTSGIGLAIANELAAKGMNIVLNGYGNSADIEAQRKRLARSHVVEVLHDGADMRRQDRIETIMARAAERFGGLDEVVQLVAFLCSDAAASITGTVMPIDSGWTAH